MLQTTIEKPVTLEGVGIHSGKPVLLQLKPARPDMWITFTVHTPDGKVAIPGKVESVVCVERCTGLGRGTTRILTVEHLLAAARGLEIDNLEVVVEGGELPIMDGSALPYVEALQKAGKVELHAERVPFALTSTFVLAEEKAMIAAVPDAEFHLDYIAHYAHPLVGTQHAAVSPGDESFASRIAPARTFGFIDEVEELRRRGLALGGSLDNALVIHKDRLSSPLRVPDEPAAHKCLDLLGDLALLGRPILGRITAFRTSHRFNVQFVRALLEVVRQAPVEKGSLTDAFSGGKNDGNK
jgi:UDP-3-O-[3-hydroxymyristoyl] N-acetylglucosamine deacetylase